MIDAGKGCEDFDFEKNTFQGSYVLDNANVLTLTPKSVLTEKGKSIYVAKHKKRIDKINSTTYLDYNSSTHSIILKYELLNFESFKVLLRLDYSTSYEFSYADDYSEFYNLINCEKEILKENNYIFKRLFLVTEIDDIYISLEKMRQSDILKNRKEIFKKPFTATITSIKQRSEKNEHYYPDFDDRKFIIYLDIEINAGSEDGFYKGLNIYFKTKTLCNPYALENIQVIKEVKAHKSYLTIYKSDIEGCDPNDYLLKKDIIIKSHLNQ